MAAFFKCYLIKNRLENERIRKTNPNPTLCENFWGTSVEKINCQDAIAHRWAANSEWGAKRQIETCSRPLFIGSHSRCRGFRNHPLTLDCLPFTTNMQRQLRSWIRTWPAKLRWITGTHPPSHQLAICTPSTPVSAFWSVTYTYFSHINVHNWRYTSLDGRGSAIEPGRPSEGIRSMLFFLMLPLCSARQRWQKCSHPVLKQKNEYLLCYIYVYTHTHSTVYIYKIW